LFNLFLTHDTRSLLKKPLRQPPVLLSVTLFQSKTARSECMQPTRSAIPAGSGLPRRAHAHCSRSLGIRTRLNAAQLNTNSQSTFASPRSFTFFSGPVCFNHPNGFLQQPPFAQADLISRMARRSSVNRAAPVAGVLRHMRCHAHVPDG